MLARPLKLVPGAAVLFLPSIAVAHPEMGLARAWPTPSLDWITFWR
jgi:hypothetical protein